MKKIIMFILFLMVVPTIVFAQSYEKSVKLKLTDEDVNINEYFNLGNANLRWSISNPSVATLIDNNIMTIKVGLTDITASNNGNDYVLHLEVVNTESTTVSDNKDINQVMQDVKVSNPQTGDEIILLVMVIVFSFLTIIFFRFRMDHGRYEE